MNLNTSRAVARSEIPGGLVVLGGDNVFPLVKIGLADLPNIGGLPAPTLRRPYKLAAMLRQKK